MYPPRNPNLETQQPRNAFFDHPQANATIEHKVDKPFGEPRPWRVDSVRYVNPTGLPEDAADYFEIDVLVGGVVAASWSTETGADGSIPADTWVDLEVVDSPDAVGDPGDELSLRLVRNGVAVLPAGRIQCEGRYL